MSDTITLYKDWAGYWQNFKELHGQFKGRSNLEPLNWQGRLLFPDGWTYAKADLAGPEWPPPMDKESRLLLQLAYWQERLRLVSQEQDSLRRDVEEAKELQQMKNAPMPLFTMAGAGWKQQKVSVNLDDVVGMGLMNLQSAAADALAVVNELRAELKGLNNEPQELLRTAAVRDGSAGLAEAEAVHRG